MAEVTLELSDHQIKRHVLEYLGRFAHRSLVQLGEGRLTFLDDYTRKGEIRDHVMAHIDNAESEMIT